MLTLEQESKISKVVERWLGNSQGAIEFHQELLKLVLEITAQQAHQVPTTMSGTDWQVAKQVVPTIKSAITTPGTGITVSFNLPWEPGKALEALEFLQTTLTTLRDTLQKFYSSAPVGDNGRTAPANSGLDEQQRYFGETGLRLSREAVESYESVRASTGPHSPDCKYPIHQCVCSKG